MIDPALLEPGARRFAELLFAAFPSWADLASAAKTFEPGSHAVGLSVQVPSPVAAAGRDLRIWACGDTVSVFWCGVDHDLIWSGLGEEDELFRHAIDFVRRVLEEEEVVAFTRRRFLWKSGSLGAFVSRAELDGRRGRRAVAVRSWRGTFDRGAAEARRGRRDDHP